MAYATVEDVQSFLGLQFADNSKPTAIADVQGFLDLIEAQIHGALESGGYDVDPQSEEAKKVLSLYCATGVSALVLDARAQTDQAALAHKRFHVWLQSVAQGAASGLETKDASGLLPGSGYTRNPSGFARPVFRRNEVQW
jgi:phage gp36-like protein